MSRQTPNSKPPKYHHRQQYSLGTLDFYYPTPPFPLTQHKQIKVGPYKSPESSQYSSPHPETRRRSQHFGSFISSSDFKPSKVDKQLSELQIINYRLEKQVQNLKFKLVQRNKECLDLRAVKEILESKVEDLLFKTRSSSHRLFEQEIQRKNQEIQFLKDYIKDLKSSYYKKHQNNLDCQNPNHFEVRQNYSINRSKIDPEIESIMTNFLNTYSNKQEKLPPGILNTTQYKDLQQSFIQLETTLNNLTTENTKLNTELSLYKKQREQLGSIFNLTKDFSKIRKQMKELRVILQSLKDEKEMSLKLILGLEDPDYSNLTASEQASLQMTTIKEDLYYSRKLIAEYHAEQCGGQACIQQ